MSSQPTTFLTPEQYLDLDRSADHKSEYFAGEMFAMAGATPTHVMIVTNIAAELRQRLKDVPCRVYASDLRLRVSSSGLYTYPDVAVVCGDSQFADERNDTLLNPVLIIEVLSESTRDYDRGRKFEHYRALPSLLEYLTVSQDTPHVEHWERQPTGQWLLTEYGQPGQSIPLDAIGCALPLAEVYHKVDWSRA
jgi:Uma2 family endonuclease